MEISLPKYAIILAGGVGSRMGADLPKQFLSLEGKPILRRTVELFLAMPFKVEIIIVMNKDSRQWWIDYCRREDFVFKHIITDGGITRFHSVKNGLKYVKDGAVVAVHDGVRPFVDRNSLIEMFEMVSANNAVIPIVSPVDTMRERLSNGGTRMVSRDNYIAVQTPQLFKSDVLKESYRQSYDVSFTDDASVVERAGYELTFCQGNRLNIKITTPEDLALARGIILNPDLSFDSLIK